MNSWCDGAACCWTMTVPREVEGCEQRGVPCVCRSASRTRAAWLHSNPGWVAVELPGFGSFSSTRERPQGGRIDVEADDVASLGELRVRRQLNSDAMRRGGGPRGRAKVAGSIPTL